VRRQAAASELDDAGGSAGCHRVSGPAAGDRPSAGGRGSVVPGVSGPGEAVLDRAVRWCSFVRCRWTSPARRASARTARVTLLPRRRRCRPLVSLWSTGVSPSIGSACRCAAGEVSLLGVIARLQQSVSGGVRRPGNKVVSGRARPGIIGPPGRSHGASSGPVHPAGGSRGSHRPQWEHNGGERVPVWSGSRGRGTSCATAHDVFPGGAPGRTRTCDLEIRRLLLYPAELRGPAPTAGADRAGRPARAA
jgi:hypothetical protein